MDWQWRLAQFTEIRWWQRYLRKKDIKAYQTEKKAYWQRVLRQAGVEIPGSATVLDAGCGPAGIFMILDNAQLVALDPLVDIYAQKLPHFNPEEYPNVKFVSQEIESYRPDQTFDFVCCFNAVNHVARLRKAIHSLINAVKPGGTILLSIDVHKYQWLKYLFRIVPLDILHPHQNTLKEYVDILTSMGCEIVDVKLLKPGYIFDYQLIIAKK